MQNNWWVYIIECRGGSLYTGITNNLDRRIKQHNRGQGCRFTKFRIPVKLIYKEVYLLKNDALKREAEIKSWRRDRKLELVLG
ncbi:MAG: GIY-YIG nuclease family protein [Candidatus Omnitrophica bacterium]|nr:GIY-YIG nuclease family protein [Candidatus Omnitrophota bacterium]